MNAVRPATNFRATLEQLSRNRRDGAPAPRREFHLRTKRIRARSEHLRARPSVVFASQPMDDDSRWRLLDPGELVHVDAELQITRSLALPDPPRYRLQRADLRPDVAAALYPPV
ncbi:hypothetical protein NJB1907E19_42950 [Mycobacterium marinum]|nr:hypothetical protein NJB1907E19_42950 [Mycobacterium marinum]